MPGANHILPFGQAGGANVLSQADYLADAQRATGNQTGIARAPLVNKAALQSSAIAAGVAQFLADNQTADVTDQLTAAQIAAMFITAMGAQFPLIASNLTIHINGTTGNDITGDGTLALPYKTIGRATTEAARYSISLTAIILSCADDDYSAETVYLNKSQIAYNDGYAIEIVGNTVTPANVKLGLVVSYSPLVYINGCDLTLGIQVWAGEIDVDHYRLGGPAQVLTTMAILSLGANAVFYGNQTNALYAQAGGYISLTSGACVGGPVYSSAFAQAVEGGVIIFNTQPTGAATGPRYIAYLNGVINTNGGGASWLPGSTAGSATNGGQYA